MSRRDGESQLGAGQDSNGSTHLGRETTGRAHVSHLVSERAHDVVTIGHQTNINRHTAKGKDPDGDGGFGIDFGILPNVVDGGKRTIALATSLEPCAKEVKQAVMT